jgi:hypothetical protein
VTANFGAAAVAELDQLAPASGFQVRPTPGLHQRQELLPVGYFHVVFTLPAPIADIAYHNKAVIYDLLFKASAETVLTIAADPKHLGAHIGITAVLHTWGSTMTHHPHIHMIVPGGGVALDGKRWLSSRPRFLLPVRVLSHLFRRLLLQKLRAAHKTNQRDRFPRAALLLASVVRDAGGDPPGGRQSRWRRLPLHVERLSRGPVAGSASLDVRAGDVPRSVSADHIAFC